MSRTTRAQRRPAQKQEAPPEAGVDVAVSAEIERKVGELLPSSSRKEIVRQLTQVVVSEFFSGPIAHPRHLREYEEISPGAADRIIGMAEKAQQHHISMQSTVVAKEFSDRRLGMIFGALSFLVLIACALVSALKGNNIAAGLFLGTAAIGGVGLFINGRNAGRSTNDE